MADSKIYNDISEEVNICAVLDTFMYIGLKDSNKVENGDTIFEIINTIEKDSDFSKILDTKPYQIIKEAISETKNPQTGELTETAKYIGNLKIGNQSRLMDDNKELKTAFGATFTDDKGKVYVAFTGTGDGEWIDNAEGMTQESTIQQNVALKYFDTVCGKIVNNAEWTPEKEIVITGHSKGGNKAQYIMLNSIYGAHIDKCYSLDGQGFSPEAIEAIKNKYGEKAYNDQLDKMYSINGDNDYVNELAIKVIRDDHIFYVKTPVESEGLFNSFFYDHDIAGMFTKLDDNNNEILGGSLNEETEQGLIGKNIKRLSKELMKLPPDQRRDVAMTLMQLLENGQTLKKGLDGKSASLENYSGFVADGVLVILMTLLSSPEGRELLVDLAPGLLEEYYKKYGNWGIAGLAVGTFILLPHAPMIIFDIYMASKLINIYYDFKRSIHDFSEDAGKFIVECGEIAKDTLQKIEKWYKENFSASYRYSIEHPYIRMNTYNLRKNADRLMAIQRRLRNLDQRLDTLYVDAISDVDLSGLMNLLRADIFIGQNHQLQKCIEYLNDTASDFEKVESRIISKLNELPE